jgi:hypothetical protein
MERVLRLAVSTTRSLQADMQAELRDIERALTSGTRDAGRGLRTELRRQVTSAGLGQRLANSWTPPYTGFEARVCAWDGQEDRKTETVCPRC